MGNLTPGATYIYESPDGGETVYAREFGKTEKVMVGQTLKARTVREMVLEDELWHNIRRAAKTNPTLQDALDNAIMIYNLTKTNE
jgi:hypothetical protein